MNTPIDCITDVAERLRLCLSRFSLNDHPDTPIAQLGLDSIDTVELLCGIHEEFGARLTEADFHADQTISGLVEAIARKTSSPSLP